jgi:hypothetical protein
MAIFCISLQPICGRCSEKQIMAISQPLGLKSKN